MNARGVATAYGASLLNVFSSLLANVWLLGVVTRVVEKQTLGLFFFVSSTASYLGLLQLSLDFAAGQRIAAALATGDETAATRIFRQTAAFNRVVAGVIAALTLGAVGVAIARVDDPDRARLYATLIALVGTSQTVMCLTRPYAAGLTGAYRLATIQVYRVGGTLLSTVAAYAAVRQGAGVIGLAAADLALQIGLGVAFRASLRRSCVWATRPVADSWAGWGAMVRYGAAVSLTSALNYACINCDPFLLQGADRPGETTAEYFVWARFPQVFYGMVWQLFGTFSPALAAAYATDPVRGAAAFRKAMAAILVLTVAGMLGLGGWLAPVVRHWAGAAYEVSDGAAFAVALAAGVGARNVLAGLSLPGYAAGRLGGVTVAHAAQLVVKVGLGLALVRVSPLVGIATADAVAAAVAGVVLGVGLLRRGEGSFAGAVAVVGGVVAATVTAAAGARGTHYLSLPATVIGVAATGAALAGAAVVLAVRLGLWPRRRTAAPAAPLTPEVRP